MSNNTLVTSFVVTYIKYQIHRYERKQFKNQRHKLRIRLVFTVQESQSFPSLSLCVGYGLSWTIKAKAKAKA